MFKSIVRLLNNKKKPKIKDCKLWFLAHGSLNSLKGDFSMSKSNYHKKIGRQGWNDDEHTSRSDIDAFYDEDMLESSSTGKKKSKKKSSKRSNHKHKYVEVIGIFNTDILGRPNKDGVILKRCSICGK